MRTSAGIAERFVFNRVLPTRAPRSGVRQTRNERQYRLTRSRNVCASLPYSAAPKLGPLIAIADALVKYIEGEWHTWYFILVRRPEDDEATIMPPYHHKGTETVVGWRAASDALNSTIRSRIVALVCDGHRGLRSEARWQGWHIQRCHFHLIARIQSRRSKWKTSQHWAEGKHIFALVKRVLTAQDKFFLKPLIEELEEIGWTNRSPEIRRILAGFVSNHAEFRTYLDHPSLRLPTTSNTAEALIGLIEDVSRRARGFKRIVTLNEWILCVIKTRRTIRCAPPVSTD